MLLVLPSPLDKLTSRVASTGYGPKVLAESGIPKPYSPVALAIAVTTAAFRLPKLFETQ